MSHYFTSQMLVLALSVPVVTRFLFNRSARIDTIVLLAPFAFAVSVLNLFVYGITIINLILILVTFYIGMINFRAQLRLFGGLVVDFYHGPFILGSIFAWFLLGAAAALLIVFCPISDTRLSLKGKASDAWTIEKQVYTGTAYSGLQKKTDYFSKPSAVLYTIEPVVESKDTVFVYVSGVCTRSDDFLPVLKQLAEKGYASVSADFSVSDITYSGNWRDNSWSLDYCMRMLKIRNPSGFAIALNSFNENKAREAKLLMDLAAEQYPDAQLVLVYDKESEKAISNALPDVPQIQVDLDGSALLALTNPLEAQLLDSERWNRARRAEFKNLPEQLAWYIINCFG